ncbi:MAG: hypothetical protein GY842_08955, partial [bacterium]|nr:hypothetical protein [bacterium]
GGETEDPLTWQWTESDRVFLGFLAEAHGQGLRVVVDGVFNHVGREFWAWRDVCARGRGSVYADWFAVREWTDDGGGVLAWDAWDGPNGSLVRFRRVGDGLHPGVEHHLFAVVRRWMDPDGDGDPSDGVDGWRLDAAEQVPHAFWRRFRRVVKSANPRALIVGEIWTDARAWLGGQEFDSVTNYPFSSPVVSYFRQGGDGYLPTDFADTLKALYQTHQPGVALGQMNLLGSHDTERAVSMLADPQLQRGADGRIPRRDLLRPDEDAYRRLKLALFTQSTYPGAPLIYYGDEVGMYGGDDPFCRGPMQWADLGSAVRTDLADVYAALARLRRGRPELRRGGYELLLADDARRLIAFRRSGASGSSVVLVNSGPTGRTIWLTLGLPLADVSWVTLRTEPDSAPAFRRQSPTRLDGRGRASFACPAIGATVVFVGGDESGLSGTKLVDSPAGPALE